MVESGGNLVRWMHVCPWKQDIESCDRVGLLEAMPAGDAEKDVEGRQWSHRVELMRDAIIYNHNNPSIIFYECAKKSQCSQITIRLKGSASDSDQFGGIKELAAPVANELDLFKAKDGDKVNHELRIVEIDFLKNL